MKSILKILLEKNASGESLDEVENDTARMLIAKATPTDESCFLCNQCGYDMGNNTIYDTGLCKGHAYCALETRK